MINTNLNYPYLEKTIVENSDFILTYNKKNFADKINVFLSK